MSTVVPRVDARARLEETYRRRTPRSAEAMGQARRYMVRGITRGWGYHRRIRSSAPAARAPT